LFDLIRSYPSIDANSEKCPHSVEQRSGFGRYWERCQRVVVLLSLEDTLCGKTLTRVCLESWAVKQCPWVEPEIALGMGVDRPSIVGEIEQTSN